MEIVKLYTFKELSQTAKQNALKELEKPSIESNEEVFSTEELKEFIDDLFFFKDGKLA